MNYENEDKSTNEQRSGVSRQFATGESQVPLVASAQDVNFLSNTTQSSKNTATDIEKVAKKIKFWKKFSIILGCISAIGYIILLVIMNLMAHGSQYGWVFVMLFSLVARGAFFVLFILSIISLVRVMVLSAKRKQHILKDYAMVVVGLVLIFSPLAISKVLSFFRISWNEDESVSVTVKSKDPYYVTGSSSSSSVCINGYRTSNDLKNVDIDDYYGYVDDAKERKLFAAESYVEQIGEEVLCQVGEFYKKNNRYPNESEVEAFASKAISEDVRSGIYNIKLDVGNAPNSKDFTILFDTNCTKKTSDQGNVVVLSPLYGGEGRYCVYNDIGEIVDNIGKMKER